MDQVDGIVDGEKWRKSPKGIAFFQKGLRKRMAGLILKDKKGSEGIDGLSGWHSA